MDLTVLYQISYGVYVIGAEDGGRPVGCVINTAIQVTSENPILAVCLSKQNYTYEVVQRTGRFSLSILSEATDPAVIAQFGFSSSRDKNKFDRFDYQVKDGLPYLKENCCGRLTCQVLSATDMETHVMVFARVADTEKGENHPPMTYAYYHTVIKGRAPKNAPTFRGAAEPVPAQPAADPAPQGQRWVCTVCGYVYEGDLTKEPDDYVCPVCSAPKSCFRLE